MRLSPQAFRRVSREVRRQCRKPVKLFPTLTIVSQKAYLVCKEHPTCPKCATVWFVDGNWLYCVECREAIEVR